MLPNKVTVEEFDRLAWEYATKHSDEDKYKWVKTPQPKVDDSWIEIHSDKYDGSDVAEFTISCRHPLYTLESCAISVYNPDNNKWITLENNKNRLEDRSKFTKYEIYVILSPLNKTAGLLDREIVIDGFL